MARVGDDGVGGTDGLCAKEGKCMVDNERNGGSGLNVEAKELDLLR